MVIVIIRRTEFEKDFGDKRMLKYAHTCTIWYWQVTKSLLICLEIYLVVKYGIWKWQVINLVIWESSNLATLPPSSVLYLLWMLGWAFRPLCYVSNPSIHHTHIRSHHQGTDVCSKGRWRGAAPKMAKGADWPDDPEWGVLWPGPARLRRGHGHLWRQTLAPVTHPKLLRDQRWHRWVWLDQVGLPPPFPSSAPGCTDLSQSASSCPSHPRPAPVIPSLLSPSPSFSSFPSLP